MKKLLALLLSVMMMVGVFALAGCSKDDAKDDGKQDTQQNQEQQDAQSPEGEEGIPEGTKLSSMYVDMMKGGKYYMHYKSTEDVDGVPTEGEYIVAYDNKNLYMNIKTGEYAMTTISDDTTMYIIDDASKTYYKMSVSDEDAAQNEAKSEEDMLHTDADYVFLSSGNAEFDSKTLYYEEYSAGESSTMRYYFEGDKLYAIDSTYDGNTTTLYILEMNSNVDAGLFKVPEGYTEVSLG